MNSFSFHHPGAIHPILQNRPSAKRPFAFSSVFILLLWLTDSLFMLRFRLFLGQCTYFSSLHLSLSHRKFWNRAEEGGGGNWVIDGSRLFSQDMPAVCAFDTVIVPFLTWLKSAHLCVLCLPLYFCINLGAYICSFRGPCLTSHLWGNPETTVPLST